MSESNMSPKPVDPIGSKVSYPGRSLNMPGTPGGGGTYDKQHASEAPSIHLPQVFMDREPTSNSWFIMEMRQFEKGLYFDLETGKLTQDPVIRTLLNEDEWMDAGEVRMFSNDKAVEIKGGDEKTLSQKTPVLYVDFSTPGRQVNIPLESGNQVQFLSIPGEVNGIPILQHYMKRPDGSEVGITTVNNVTGRHISFLDTQGNLVRMKNDGSLENGLHISEIFQMQVAAVILDTPYGLIFLDPNAVYPLQQPPTAKGLQISVPGQAHDRTSTTPSQAASRNSRPSAAPPGPEDAQDLSPLLPQSVSPKKGDAEEMVEPALVETEDESEFIPTMTMVVTPSGEEIPAYLTAVAYDEQHPDRARVIGLEGEYRNVLVEGREVVTLLQAYGKGTKTKAIELQELLGSLELAPNKPLSFTALPPGRPKELFVNGLQVTVQRFKGGSLQIECNGEIFVPQELRLGNEMFGRVTVGSSGMLRVNGDDPNVVLGISDLGEHGIAFDFFDSKHDVRGPVADGNKLSTKDGKNWKKSDDPDKSPLLLPAQMRTPRKEASLHEGNEEADSEIWEITPENAFDYRSLAVGGEITITAKGLKCTVKRLTKYSCMVKIGGKRHYFKNEKLSQMLIHTRHSRYHGDPKGDRLVFTYEGELLEESAMNQSPERFFAITDLRTAIGIERLDITQTTEKMPLAALMESKPDRVTEIRQDTPDLEMRGFSLAKENVNADSMDIVIPEDPQQAVLATVCDGVSASFRPSAWSRLIVERMNNEGHQKLASHPEFLSLIRNLSKDWEETQIREWLIPRWKTFSIHNRQWNYWKREFQRGSETTMAHYSFSREDIQRTGETVVNVAAIGDTNFSLVRPESNGTFTHVSFPIQTVDGFDAYPWTIPTNAGYITEQQIFGRTHMQQAQFTARIGDYLVLTTDALAKYIEKYSKPDKGENPWDRLLNISTVGEFGTYIEELRREGKIELDDTTMLVVKLKSSSNNNRTIGL